MRSKGAEFETLALKYLRKQGLTERGRNLYSRGGEIDLLMQDQDSLVFVEVRFRQSASHGSALESVTPQKQAKIVRAAKHYLHKHALWQHNVRFDVVAIEPAAKWLLKRYQITWVKAAFNC